MQSTTTNYKILEGRRKGSTRYSSGGFEYTVVSKHPKIVLRCVEFEKFACLGRARVVDNKLVVSKEHNHPADPLLAQETKFRSDLKAATKWRCDNLKTVYKDVSENFDDEVTDRVPFDYIGSTLNKVRKNCPVKPDCCPRCDGVKEQVWVID